MKLDQRFSVVATKLSSASVLQTPAAFAAHIEQHVRFQSGRLTTSVELNQGAWNWQGWLAALGVAMSGLTPSVAAPDVCHCWRFVRRADLREYVPPSVENQLVVPLEFQSDVMSPSDVVLLLKQKVSSRELSQMPVLILPEVRLRRLPVQNLQPALRNPLGANEITQFRKTADRLSRKPWNLKDAESYLNDWVQRNIENRAGTPGCVDFVLFGRRDAALATPGPPPPQEWRNFAPGPPRVVEISGCGTRKRATAPGPAEAAPGAAAPQAEAEVPRRRRRQITSGGVVVPPAAGAPMVVPPAELVVVPPPAAEPLVVAPPPAARPKEGPPPLGCAKCRHSRNGCAKCRGRQAAGSKRAVSILQRPAGAPTST